MKKIATYSPSVEELTDKIRHIIDNYMFENKMDQANIMSFVYDNIEYDKVKLINTPGIGKEIAFQPMRDSYAEPIMLTDLIREARQNGNIALLTPYFSCRSLFKGDKVLSKVGTHQFLKGEDISSIHKDLYGEFKVLMVKKERSLLHPSGREAVTLRNIKNTDRPPFKIYPSEMKDVSIAVKPRINSYRGLTILEDINKDLNKLALKDFDIELSDYIFLSAKDFNPNIENQYSSNAIDTINVRNGRLESFHMKDTLYHIQCLSKSGLEKVENAVKSKMVYLRKFASETFEKQEEARLSAKARELQDMLAKLPGMEPGKTIKLDKGIPLDDKVVINSIGDMVVDEVTYIGNAYNHAKFQVTDGGRDIPFSRMMEWNQEQVYDAVKSLIEEKKAEEKTYDSLEYDGKTWPLRSIVLPTTGEQVLVGTVALDQALRPDDGHAEWKDRKAQSVDERIFYYVEDGEINLSSKELAALVECEALDIEKEETVHDSVDNNEDDRLLSDADITEAIINRTIDSSVKQFLPEQQQMILDFLKKFETVDQKMQALSTLWDEACKDKRMNVYDEWKESVKEELNDLASGVIRDNSRGLIP